jgi:hypothetical protein
MPFKDRDWPKFHFFLSTSASVICSYVVPGSGTVNLKSHILKYFAFILLFDLKMNFIFLLCRSKFKADLRLTFFILCFSFLLRPSNRSLLLPCSYYSFSYSHFATENTIKTDTPFKPDSSEDICKKWFMLNINFIKGK